MVVAIDPATTSKKNSDDTGIVICGVGTDGHGYVIDDRTAHCSPNEWATIAVKAYHRHHADRIIGEVNNGGDLVETVIRNLEANIPYSPVRASRGKQTRAEPIAALYEQGKVHHVGLLAQLEDQMVTWIPGSDWSPDRIDALVWGLSYLMLGPDLSVEADAIPQLDQSCPWKV